MNFVIDNNDNILLDRTIIINKVNNDFDKITALTYNIEKVYRNIVNATKPKGFNINEIHINNISFPIKIYSVQKPHKLVQHSIFKNIEAELVASGWKANIDYLKFPLQSYLTHIFNGVYLTKLGKARYEAYKSFNMPKDVDIIEEIKNIQKDEIFMNWFFNIFEKSSLWNEHVKAIYKYLISPDNGLIYLIYKIETNDTVYDKAIIMLSGEVNYYNENINNKDLKDDAIAAILKRNGIKFFPNYLKNIIKFENTSSESSGMHDAYLIKFGYLQDDYSVRAIAYPNVINDFVCKLKLPDFKLTICSLEDNLYNETKKHFSKVQVGGRKMMPMMTYTTYDKDLQIGIYLNCFEKYDPAYDNAEINDIFSKNCYIECVDNYKGVLLIEKLTD